MRKLIFIITVILLSGCNQLSSKEKFNIDEINIIHEYENGTLTSIIEDLEEHQDIEIQMNLTMPNMEHNLENISFYKEDAFYKATIQLPMDGVWDLNYLFEKDNQTYFNSFTEIFGEISNEQKKDYTANLEVSPEPILPNQETNFKIKMTNQELEIIENVEIKLEFHMDNLHINKTMDYKNGIHNTSINFDEIGIYNLTIFIHDKDKNKHYEEKVKIPVGIDHTDHDHNQEDHNHH